MTTAILALGSNLGDRYAHLRGAVEELGEAVLAVSGVYQSAPWGDPEQPDYLNAVILVEDAGADAHAWLDRARALERAAGRVRDPGRRFGPRTLDVDVIAAWTIDGEPVTSDEPDLVLPHPRAHERAFVLRPWLEIQPYARLPGHGWVFDLIRTEAVAADVGALTPRPDFDLQARS